MGQREICDINLHTSYMHRAGFKALYVFLMLGGLLFLRTFCLDSVGRSCSLLLQIHAVVTFVLLHWTKGMPQSTVLMVEEKIEVQTVWEQIDDGFVGTPTRLFLASVPILVFFATFGI